jgi:hypothetical protein
MSELVELTKQAIHQHSTITTTFATSAIITPSDPRVQATNPISTQAVLRVHKTSPAQHLKQSMSQSIKHATQQIAQAFSRTLLVPTTTSPAQFIESKTMSREKRKQCRKATAPSAPNATTPAANTRSKTNATTKADAPPSTRTRVSRKIQGNAAVVATIGATTWSYARKLNKKMELLEHKVHQAMVVMDKETGQ